MKDSKKNTSYYKILITSFAIIATAIFAITSLTYIYATNFLAKKTRVATLSAFSTITSSVESVFTDINDIMFGLANDPFLQNDFSELSVRQKIWYNNYLFNKYYINSNDAISSIMIYYTNSNKVVNQQHAVSLEEMQNPKWLNYIDELPNKAFNNKIFYSENLATRIMPFPYNSLKPSGYIIVEINLPKFFAAYSSSEEKFCIIDSNNALAYGNEEIYNIFAENAAAEDSVSLTELFDKPAKISGKKYIFSVIDTPGNNFKHIKATEASRLFFEIRFFRNIAIAVAFIITIIAFFIYKKHISSLYKPIQTLLDTYGNSYTDRNTDGFNSISNMFATVLAQKEDMEKFYNKSKHALLQNILLNLCSGNFDDEQYILDSLDSVGFPINGRDYTVAIASLNDNSNKKISRELIFDIPFPSVHIISVFLHDNKMVFLINTPLNYGKIIEIVHCIQDLMADNYKITCNFGIGNTYDALTKYHISFREALDALTYNVSSKSIIHINDCIPHGKNDKFYFTSQQELQLIEAIKLANAQDALSTFDEIYSVLSATEYTPSFCSSLMWQIVNTLIRAFAAMGYEYSDIYGSSLINDFTKYIALTDKKHMYNYVKDKIITAIDFITNSHQHNNQLVVEKVKKFLNEHYTEDLSLDILTDITNLSYPYLSSLFKSTTGETIIKYVTDLRMERGATLLKDTDTNINDISATLGYNNTRTFTKNFKATYGLTPSEYRKQYQE